MVYNKKVLASILTCIVTLLLLAVFSYRNSQKFIHTTQWVTHTHRVIFEFEQVLVTCVDAETGERGYIITGDTSYLSPFHSSKLRIHEYLDTLKWLTKYNPEQLSNIAEIDTESALFFDLLADRIRTREAYGFDSVQALIRGGVGKRLLEDIRMKLDKAKALERKLLSERVRKAEYDRSSFNRFFTLLILTFIVFLVIFYFVITSNLTALKKAEREASHKNTELREIIKMLQESEAELKNRQKDLPGKDIQSKD